MESTTAFSPAWPRTLPRLGVEAHTQFVSVLVAELQACVSGVRAAAARLAAAEAAQDGGGDVDLVARADIERETNEISRLVRLLNAIDGSRARRRLTPMNLPSLVVDVAKSLELSFVAKGQWGREEFLVDAESVRTGVEFLFLALAGNGQPAEISVVNDGYIVIDGAADLNDPRISWQLRSARRVLEREGCRIRLVRTGDRCRFEIRA